MKSVPERPFLLMSEDFRGDSMLMSGHADSMRERRPREIQVRRDEQAKTALTYIRTALKAEEMYYAVKKEVKRR
jgi:hypothetical protein